MNAEAADRRPKRQRAPKSDGAFLTIGELAEELQLEQYVLRYWETKFPQIQPLKRAGGRRYYRAEDVALVRGIQTMLHRDGYTIRGVQKFLSDKKSSPIATPAAAPEQNIHAPRAAETQPGVQKAELQKLLQSLQEMRRLISG